MGSREDFRGSAHNFVRCSTLFSNLIPNPLYSFLSCPLLPPMRGKKTGFGITWGFKTDLLNPEADLEFLKTLSTAIR